MNIPKNIEVLPGVQTDFRGRQYRIGRYPSGKQVLVPYVSAVPEAPKAQMLPIPQEPLPQKPSPKTAREIGSGRSMHFRPLRLVRIRFRERITQQQHEAVMPNSEGEHYFNMQLRPLMRFDGKQWHAIESPPTDWHFMTHEDSKDQPEEQP